MPLTTAGMFVEIWPGRPKKENKVTLVEGKLVDNRLEGAIVFIPKGVLLLVRGDTVHAGDMHCDTYKNPYGNPRLHIYVKTREMALVEGKTEIAGKTTTRIVSQIMIRNSRGQ